MIRSLSSLVRAFRLDLKLRQKLLISYLAIIVIPFVILAVFISQRVSKIVEERIAYSADQAFQQAAAFLEYKLYNVLKVSHLILVDPNVNAILLRDLRGYDLRRQRVDMEALTNLFFPLQDGINIDRVRLYVRGELDYAEENVNLFSLPAARGTRWFRSLETSLGSYVWCPSEYLASDGKGNGDTLSMARFMLDLSDLRNRIAVLRIDFRKSQVRDILRKSSALPESFSYVQNAAGDIVAASSPAMLERYAPFVSSAGTAALPEGGLGRISTRMGDALVEQRSLESTDWRMISIIPVAGIAAQSSRIRDQLFLVILGIAAAAYLLAYFVTGPVTRRLSGIMEKMQGAKKGSLEKLALPEGRDEVGELAVTYDMMIDEITTLMAQEERTQKELKGAELKALQAQINPHFLYNTLDMIKWMARKGMADEIEELLTTLSTFYRLSLSEGRETIPIRDELRHVELYARIQNMRFHGAIDFGVDVEEQVLDRGILKVTLQPLVENSILHGIIEKSGKRGRIRVRGALTGEVVTLCVEDDGIGMDAAALAAILDPAAARRAGFGVRNIHERFKLFYGEEFGLSYDSSPGFGARVTIRLPSVPAAQESLHD